MVMETDIYEIGDVAAILGIEKSLVKNWTIGKPFAVLPSVRASSGTGSRNWFGRNELFCFALVRKLNEAGAPVAAIEKLLDKQSDLWEDGFWESHDWVVVSYNGHDAWYEINIAPDATFNVRLEPEHEMVYFYAVNLKKLVEAVVMRIVSFNIEQIAITAPRPHVKKRAKEKRG